jgi:solute carrier family 30 (zinc transporter), member 9
VSQGQPLRSLKTSSGRVVGRIQGISLGGEERRREFVSVCCAFCERISRNHHLIMTRSIQQQPSPDTNIAKMFRIPVNPSKLREISSDYPRPTKTQEELTSKKIQSSKQTVYLALAGNMVITVSKAAVWIGTGSSAMLSEAIHSLVDSGNQALLLIGLRGAQSAPDARFQYGYGKSVYFWSLVSALGTFWCGAGISMWNSVSSLINPSLELHSVGWETWTVLGVAFVVDGTVLYKTLQKVYLTKPEGMDLLSHIRSIRDPTMQAVLMEDAAACGGVLIAVLGIGSAQATGFVVLDSVAGMGIAGILGAMGLYLARLNQKYLMGQSVGNEITEGIKHILLAQESIDEVHSVQSQWVGPYSFSYKAEIDFDGTYIAAKLMNRSLSLHSLFPPLTLSVLSLSSLSSRQIQIRVLEQQQSLRGRDQAAAGVVLRGRDP